MTDLNSPENPNSPAGPASSVPLPLRIAVIGMGLALVTMVVLVAGRFIDRRADRQSTAQGQGVPWEIEVTRGSSDGVKKAELEGRILTVTIAGGSGHDRVVLIDIRKGEIVGRIQLVSP